MHKRTTLITLAIAIPFLCLLTSFAYNLPLVHDRLAWRVEELQARIKYALNPPEEVVFIPQSQATGAAQATPSSTPTASLTPLPSYTPPGPTDTPAPTATSSPSPTPLPGQVQLTGIRHEYQKWNNCGPANLAMALSYWGWQGDQSGPANYMKPNPRDKNVMPYEMADYVLQNTPYKAIVRAGGDLQLLKAFIAAGFPVVVEKGFEGPQFDGWMGHYEVVSGYDDARERFTVQDSYIMANMPLPYEQMQSYWRAFNYTYIVVYPPEREAEVLAILGPQADETYNYQYAAQLASDEIFALSGRDLYFAWYNRGTNLTRLQDYAGAALAYDEAFAIYPTIPEEERPWRMLWYQTGPYFAYYYSGRLYDVLNLASTTIDTANEPAIEESFYWRAMAKSTLGDDAGAIADLRTSLEWHPDFQPSLALLGQLGAQP